MQRELLHSRSIELKGYLRRDGLYELEARLTDRKNYDSRRFPDQTLPAGEPLHDMRVSMSFDEDLLIHEFRTTMTATPYDGCPEAAPNFASLAGLRIQPGFLREANQRVAGVKGCTHIRELLQQIATTAYQTVVGVRLRKEAEDEASSPGNAKMARQAAQTGPAARPAPTPGPKAEPESGAGMRAEPRPKPTLIDSCIGYRADGEWVRVRWPAFYTGKGAVPADGDY